MALAEAAASLVRGAGLDVLAIYYIGTLPFITGAVSFWAGMARMSDARDYVELWSLMLALTFIWMKVWQARYCQLLMARLHGDTPKPWPLRAFLRATARQAAIQATGLWLLPLAMIIALPFPWAYAFYQNATVLEDGHHGTLRDAMSEASRQARDWPAQNMALIWLLSPLMLVAICGIFLVLLPTATALMPEAFAQVLGVYVAIYVALMMLLAPISVVIAVNAAMGIVLGAYLLKIFGGVDTAFVKGMHAILNGTFLATVSGIVYLCLDPLVKGAYTLRCFWGASRRTGADLRVALRRHAGTLLLLAAVAIVTLGGPATAAEHAAPEAPAISPHALDETIGRELKAARYTWHSPREEEQDGERSFIAKALLDASEKLTELGNRLGGWIEDLLGRSMPDSGAPGGLLAGLGSMHNLAEFVLYLLLFVLLAVLLVMALQVLRQRHIAEAEVDTETAPAPPDLEDESTSPEALPEEGWLELADGLFSAGDYRLGLRALFLATLAHLAHSQWIRIARHKSNRDYARELARRAHADADPGRLFRESARIYESVWYGTHEAADAALRTAMLRNLEELRHAA